MVTTDAKMSEALTRLTQLRQEALAAIEAAQSTVDLEKVRIRFTGRKSELKSLLRLTPTLASDDDKKRFGAAVNGADGEISRALEARGESLSLAELQNRLASERLDVTLPGTDYSRGCSHPLLRTMRDIVGVFAQMGYTVYEGPEVEWESLNFDLLNIPRHHPARDMQDTFWMTNDIVMRTHTSPAQIRFMRENPVPIRVVVPGRTYRNEAVDATHEDEFYQIEGLALDSNITMADLKGTLTELVHRFFGRERRVRFRPGYFPFTEPSAEMDVSCELCAGEGCRSCGGEGWLEVLGSGMVHPNVIRNGGYDPAKISGFAFGMGIERMTILKYGITDIRLFREDDLRFLRQFN